MYSYVIIVICHWRDSQELKSDNDDSNDLPYCHHKRACLCLVCGAKMLEENKYTLELQYLCILTTCNQRALPTIKGRSEGLIY